MSPKPVSPAGSSQKAAEQTGLKTPYLFVDADKSPDEAKAHYRAFYNEVTRHLNSSPYREFALFLSNGYVANGNPQFARRDVPASMFNRNFMKMVLELVGDCEIDGRRVLDVGCGRGGTIFALDYFFSPKSLHGVDLSPDAVSFCRKTQEKPNIAFCEGDAEHLPFPDDSFDVVTNVESSHLYPSIHKFYSEVARVLAPGGHFLYTDMMAPDQWREGLKYLSKVGLLVEHDRDITANVMLSCDQITRNSMKVFGPNKNQQMVEDFLVIPGSSGYEGLRTGELTYRIVRLRAPDGNNH
jgi:ubiquinone/menaquinone biosynthesis C-methylase UbiE